MINYIERKGGKGKKRKRKWKERRGNQKGMMMKGVGERQEPRHAPRHLATRRDMLIKQGKGTTRYGRKKK